MSRIDLAFPFTIDAAHGRTVLAKDDAAHVRDLIEQVLFTNPGERVNRPDFGVGLMRVVFMPENDQAVATLRAVVQGSLQQWLGGVIGVESVDIRTDDATLSVAVRYVVLGSGERRTEQFVR